MRIEFLTIPPVGTVLMLDDQAYRLISSEPYIRKDGVPSRLLTWEAGCAECGAAFNVITGLIGRDFNRRCSEHRRPAVRVSGKAGRGSPVKVKVIDPTLENRA